jgi:hypothetical protein
MVTTKYTNHTKMNQFPDACHPERSEGSMMIFAGSCVTASFARLRMTDLGVVFSFVCLVCFVVAVP